MGPTHYTYSTNWDPPCPLYTCRPFPSPPLMPLDYRLRHHLHSLPTPTYSDTSEAKQKMLSIAQKRGQLNTLRLMDRGDDAWPVLTCAKDDTIINQIMLRFRPIAPKPADGDGISGSWKPEARKGLVTSKRMKRKYVRVKKNIDYRKRSKKEVKSVPLDLKEMDMDGKQLFGSYSGDPLSSKRCRSFACIDPIIDNEVQVQDDKIRYGGVDPVFVETWVRMESVTDTNIDVLGLGSSDIERKMNLERDTCPGFISDELNRVQWINGAYRKMACGREVNESESEVKVKLEVKEKLLPFVSCNKQIAAFTCWARLQYTGQKNKCWSQMVPCDVWRMNFGGFAWRLDVQAALGLGIQNNIGK